MSPRGLALDSGPADGRYVGYSAWLPLKPSNFRDECARRRWSAKSTASEAALTADPGRQAADRPIGRMSRLAARAVRRPKASRRRQRR